jgi:RimJ/RimL family protein N-acetyltransferase
MSFQFRPITEADISVLMSWLNEPHVAEFWQESQDIEVFREKFLFGLSGRGVAAYIVELEGRAIGFIQSYEAALVGGGWWPGFSRGIFGIDQFIGEKDLIGRGIGTELIKAFVETLFDDPTVSEVIADPDPNNGRAIRAYEKAGFVKVREITTPGGPAFLMSMKRESQFK